MYSIIDWVSIFVSSKQLVKEQHIYTVLSGYNCTHACDLLHGKMRICNHGSRKVIAVVHDHEWLRGLKP